MLGAVQKKSVEQEEREVIEAKVMTFDPLLSDEYGRIVALSPPSEEELKWVSDVKSLQDVEDLLMSVKTPDVRLRVNRIFHALVKKRMDPLKDDVHLMNLQCRLKEEAFHVIFVRECCQEVFPCPNDGSQAREEEERQLLSFHRQHDWSKDWVYMAMAVMVYTYDSESLKSSWEEERDFHFKMESHHPEHVDYSQEPLSDADIKEMALDHLARAAQFNRGIILISQMMKYMPKFRQDEGHQIPGFPYKNIEIEMQEAWCNYLYQLKDLVEVKWEEIGQRFHPWHPENVFSLNGFYRSSA